MKPCNQTQARLLASPENILCGNCYRITLLTKRLVRLEYAEDGIFEDAPHKLSGTGILPRYRIPYRVPTRGLFFAPPICKLSITSSPFLPTV